MLLVLLSPETVMTFLLLSFVALVTWRAGLSLLRLWASLPDRNVDFDLTPPDLDLERRP